MWVFAIPGILWLGEMLYLGYEHMEAIHNLRYNF